MFSGVYTAIITPFCAEPKGHPEIDMRALDDLVEWQIACGIDGFVVCGTTGESVTLSHEERLTVIERVRDVVKGRVAVIAGTGSNNTRTTVEFTKEVKRLGIDGALVVSPYYNKPQQEGLFEHFSTVAKEGGLPVILYNIPGRTGVAISIPIFERLSKVQNIVAVKEASGSAQVLLELSRVVGDKLGIFAGDCGYTYFVMSVGGKGVISACANVIPREMKAIVDKWNAGDVKGAYNAQIHALPIIDSMFLETNPAPAKAALKILGKLENETFRLPLVPVANNTRENIAKLLREGGVHV